LIWVSYSNNLFAVSYWCFICKLPWTNLIHPVNSSPSSLSFSPCYQERRTLVVSSIKQGSFCWITLFSYPIYSILSLIWFRWFSLSQVFSLLVVVSQLRRSAETPQSQAWTLELYSVIHFKFPLVSLLCCKIHGDSEYPVSMSINHFAASSSPF